MPYEITWRPPHGLIKRHHGHVYGRDVLAANVQVEADARFDDLKYVINDFRDCTGLTFSPEEIVEIAAIDKAASIANPHILIAVVGTHPGVLAATNAYADDPLTTFPIRVFTSMNDAYAWLNVGTD